MSGDINSVHVERYNIFSILLHWLMFFMILFAFGLALIFDDLPKSIKPFWVNIHFVIGALVLLLLLVRVVWRFLMGTPPLPSDMHPHTKRATQLVHALLYGLMALIPIMGIMTAIYRGRGIDFGFFALSSPFETDRTVARFYKEIHEFTAWALFLLAGGHAILALFHHYVRKDGILLRMMSAKKVPSSDLS